MRIKSVVAQFVVFFLPLVAALYNTFQSKDYGRSMIWDSAHYELSGKLLTKWLIDLSQGHYISPHDCEMGYSILLDGMIMPGFAALLMRLGDLFHAAPDLAVLTGQCVLAGLNSLLIFRLSRRLGFSRALSCVGGLCWGLYPGQVIGASRFMSEPLAATTSMIYVLLLSSLLPRGKADESKTLTVKDWFIAFCAGIMLVITMHTKAAMAPICLSLFAIALLNLRPLKRALTLVAVFATGAFITITPWLMFTQSTMQHRTFLPERMPGFNLAVGLDSDVDGWAPYPKTEYVNLVEHDKPAITLANALKDRPIQLAALFARKLERLYRNGWNDFYYESLGLPKASQILIHQLLLLGGGLGVVYLFVMERFLRTNIRRVSGSDFIKIASLLMVAANFVFVIFEAQSRYAFPTMPYIMLLTLIGIDHLEHTWHSRAISASCILAMVFVVINRIELAPLLVKPLGGIENAIAAVNFALALSFAVWLTACCRAAEAKRVGGPPPIDGIPGLSMGKDRSKTYFSWPVLIIALTTAFAFLQLKEQYALPLEWYCQLPPQQTIERRFTIPEKMAQNFLKNRSEEPDNSWAIIIVDGRPDVAEAQLKINGKTVEAPQLLIPAVDKEVKEPSESAVVYEAARAAGQDLSKLRQWRFVRVRLNDLNLTNNRTNTISLTAGDKGAVIFGQYRRKVDSKMQMTPALWGFSLGKWSTDGDMRCTDKNIVRVVQSSQCKAQGKSEFASASDDLAPAAGQQSGEYRLYLVLGRKIDTAPVNSDLPAEKNMQFKKSFKIVL